MELRRFRTSMRVVSGIEVGACAESSGTSLARKAPGVGQDENGGGGSVFSSLCASASFQPLQGQANRKNTAWGRPRIVQPGSERRCATQSGLAARQKNHIFRCPISKGT